MRGVVFGASLWERAMRAMGFAGGVIAAMGRSCEGGDGCVGARHARDGIAVGWT